MRLNIETDSNGTWFRPTKQTQHGVMRDAGYVGEYRTVGGVRGLFYPIAELKRVVTEGPKMSVFITAATRRVNEISAYSGVHVVYALLYTMTGYDIDDYRDAWEKMQ